MSAQDRLECLMLSRRLSSDLSIPKPSNGAVVQLKMKLPRGEVQKLIEMKQRLLRKLWIFVCPIPVMTVSFFA
uniref:Putative ovule protein n=1 Tax=Solanum chacoense TaxID=4108 RepID=A0A0V0GJZ3_SOLCH